MHHFSITFAPKQSLLHEGNRLHFDSEKDVDDFAKKYFSRSYGMHPLWGNVIPIETLGSPRAFFKQLLVPNTSLVSKRVHSKVRRIFLWPLALIADRFTLPLRLLLAIPWIIWNGLRSPHPFATYCHQNNHKDLLEKGKVHVLITKPGHTSTHTIALRAMPNRKKQDRSEVF